MRVDGGHMAHVHPGFDGRLGNVFAAAVFVDVLIGDIGNLGPGQLCGDLLAEVLLDVGKGLARSGCDADYVNESVANRRFQWLRDGALRQREHGRSTVAQVRLGERADLDIGGAETALLGKIGKARS